MEFHVLRGRMMAKFRVYARATGYFSNSSKRRAGSLFPPVEDNPREEQRAGYSALLPSHFIGTTAVSLDCRAWARSGFAALHVDLVD